MKKCDWAVDAAFENEKTLPTRPSTSFYGRANQSWHPLLEISAQLEMRWQNFLTSFGTVVKSDAFAPLIFGSQKLILVRLLN